MMSNNTSPVRTNKSRVHSYPRSSAENIQTTLDSQQDTIDTLHRQLYAVKRQRTSPTNQECAHTETEVVNGVIECMDCGMHLEDIMDQEQEWRYYRDSDNKNNNDPSRCQFRKTPDKGIRKDLEKLNFPPNVINIADQYYTEVTQGEIKRGDLRKGIMFACVFEAYKDINKHQMPDALCKLFCIDKQNGSRGLNYFMRRKPKKERNYVTAANFIPKYCEKFGFTEESLQEVLELYNQLKLRSPKIDHSYPQSVACGCVYYVLKRKNIEISGEQFGTICNISSITVVKKSNEIEEIMNAE